MFTLAMQELMGFVSSHETKPMIGRPSTSATQTTGTPSTSATQTTGTPSTNISKMTIGETVNVTLDRQRLREAFSCWFMQSGEYQRPDITLYDRLQIATRFWAPQRAWGEVTRLAEEYNLSRVTIYDIANRIGLLFQPSLPGAVAGLKDIFNQKQAAMPTVPFEPERRFDNEEISQLKGRLILTSVFPGGMTLRPIEELLAQIPGLACSDSTIWRFINLRGLSANQVLHSIDYSQIDQSGLLVAIDETFFDDWPILFVVEPASLAIVGFYVSADGDRSSLTWDPLMLCLTEDQNLSINGAMADGASTYPKVFQNLFKTDDLLQGDHFHVKMDLKKLLRQLERKAFGCMKAEEKARQKYNKEKTVQNKQKLEQAIVAAEQAMDEHETFSICELCLSDALEFVDSRTGQIRSRSDCESLFDEVTEAMAQFKNKEIVKKARSLSKYKPRLFVYFSSLEEELALLRACLLTKVGDPLLVQLLERLTARYWWFNHQVVSLQKRVFRFARDKAKEELASWIEGEPALYELVNQLFTQLSSVQRTSSAVENINSIFKPLVKRKKHFGCAKTVSNFVALFVLWHNMRVFADGKRKNKSPFEILGVDLGATDWRTLLGFPPI